MAADNPRRWGNLAGPALAVIAALCVFTPPIVFQARHFELSWHDVGLCTRALWNLYEYGRFAIYSDGSSDLFGWQHLMPFFYILSIPVRLFGTMGYVVAVTAALAVAAGYVFRLSADVCQSSRIGGLVAVAFVVNPYTYAIALSLHVETFGILFIIAFAYYAFTDRGAGAWLMLLLGLTVKEDMWVYAIVAAMMVTRRGRLPRTIAFCAACIGYYVLVVRVLGHWWYPSANYPNSFYQTNGHAMTTMQIAAAWIRDWRTARSLLLSGPGLLFQTTFLFVGAFGGWRYLLVCAVMFMWLSFPDGPPRSTLAFYYSYAALLVAFINVPFALRNVRDRWSRLNLSRRARMPGSTVAAVVTCAVIATDIAMHRPGLVPPAIASEVDSREVYGDRSQVNVPVVRFLIDQYLANNQDSVLAQFYTIAAIPQRHGMYITFRDGGPILEGKHSPAFVLLDLHANDPLARPDLVQSVAAMLRRGNRYRPIWDEQDVLLYQRIGPGDR